MGNVPERMVTMKLSNHYREKECYEECEALIIEMGRLSRVLEEVEVEYEEAGVKNVTEAIYQLREVQNKLAAIGLK